MNAGKRAKEGVKLVDWVRVDRVGKKWIKVEKAGSVLSVGVKPFLPWFAFRSYFATVGGNFKRHCATDLTDDTDGLEWLFLEGNA